MAIGIDRLTLMTGDAAALAEFYCEALGFRPGVAPHSGALSILLTVGHESIELVESAGVGLAQAAAKANETTFQHFAIVVSDMDAAFRRLNRAKGWQAISRVGPQRLPASSGGVTAFKFRDPEGHPLELLAFDPGATPDPWKGRAQDGLFLGIDHTAITVADTAASLAFYSRLGFRQFGGSLNQGLEQDRLDALDQTRVEVTALALPRQTPHLELLCYHHPLAKYAQVADHDIAATRIVLSGSGDPVASTRDPDGHRLNHFA